MTSSSSSPSSKQYIQKLQRAIVNGLEDVKAQNIVVFNTEHLSSLFERVIVASGTSNRQTRALTSSVNDAVREAGFAKPRMEGGENGEWIIVDCGQAVVHIMQPMIRQYYNLEELWGSKPIDLKDILAVDPDEEQVPAAKPIRRKKAGVAVAADAPDAAAVEPKKAAAKKTDTPKAAPKKPKVKASGDDAPVEKKAPVRKRTTVKATVSTDGGAAGQAKPKKVKTLVVGAPVASKAAANRKPAAAKNSSRKA